MKPSQKPSRNLDAIACPVRGLHNIAYIIMKSILHFLQLYRPFLKPFWSSLIKSGRTITKLCTYHPIKDSFAVYNFILVHISYFFTLFDFVIFYLALHWVAWVLKNWLENWLGNWSHPTNGSGSLLIRSIVASFTVVWKNYLLIFLTKISYFTSQEVGNPVQIIKNVELLRFQPILQNLVTLVESLFTKKSFKAVSHC